MEDDVFMKEKALLKLFKPYKIVKTSFLDFLDDKTKRTFWKHRIWFECSKSEDESCINTKCKYNFVNSHDDELYVELMDEIKNQQGWQKEKRNGDFV